MLTVTDINQYYGGSHTLRGMSLEARKGECTTLLGRNGVGKTTLLRCLMGVLPVASGNVEFDGHDITRLAAPPARGPRASATCRRDARSFARLTVEENIRMGMATKSSRDARRIRDDIFQLFPVLKEMLRRRGGDLSGGQQQQLAIARALVADPKLHDPRRAHRRHPALDHQGHRARDPHAAHAVTWPSCWSSSTTISRASWPTVRGDATRRGRDKRGGADMDADNVRSYLSV